MKTTPIILSLFFCGIDGCVSVSKKQRDTPKCSKTNQSVDDSADKRCLTAKDPRNNVKSKQSERPPVDTTDDKKKKCYSIKNHDRRLCLSWLYSHIYRLDTGSYSITEVVRFMRLWRILRIFQTTSAAKCLYDHRRLLKVGYEFFCVGSFVSVYRKYCVMCFDVSRKPIC